MTVEALLMDFGGVLTRPGRAHLSVFCREEGIDEIELKEFLGQSYSDPADDDPLSLLETGELSLSEFETCYARRLSERFGCNAPPAGLAARLQGDLSIEWDVVQAVTRVRRSGITTAMVSNSWSEVVYPTSVLAVFDLVVLSRDVCVRKPDPRFFDLVLRKLAIGPQACLFVDDVRVNCEVAASMGMQVLHHREPTQTVAALAATCS